MDRNDIHPWIWLGFDEIYVRWPGQALWETLSEAGLPWAARISLSGGEEFLRRPGQKLGLNDSEAARQLDQLILKQLLEKIGEPAILFAPPRQAQGLRQAAQKLNNPPHAIILDSCLMVKQKTVSFREYRHHPESDIYLFDWTKTNQGIIRQFIKDQHLLYKTALFPVLMTVKAYTEGRAEILSHYQGKTGISAATATLHRSQQAYKGARPIGLGLVWAWGFGVKMWQWALKPTALADDKTLHFECIPPLNCRISSENGEKRDEWPLLAPVMKKYYSRKENEDATG
ncbi:MAG: hypothetical protein VSS75_031435 [Candidatus Parabeggiatoa sp.]|nr:hypothetical protein [Candidatus Parabeggiatoa sp.]